MIRKAIKKPVEIEFIEFEDLWQMLLDYHNHMFPIAKELIKIKFSTKNENEQYLIIPTLEGNMKMTDKDVLIIGIRNEIYPCKIDIFEETYNIIKGEK